MKRIEAFIGGLLLALLVYAIIEMIFSVAGYLQDSPTFFVPLRVNAIVALAGLLISGLAGVFFPLWDTSENGMVNIVEMSHFEHRYKVDFWMLMVGFIGILIWTKAEKFLSFLFIFGLIFILLAFIWVFITHIYSISWEKKSS
jgi:hypothetical protein